jgi:hypothetical protein
MAIITYEPGTTTNVCLLSDRISDFLFKKSTLLLGAGILTAGALALGSYAYNNKDYLEDLVYGPNSTISSEKLAEGSYVSSPNLFQETPETFYFKPSANNLESSISIDKKPTFEPETNTEDKKPVTYNPVSSNATLSVKPEIPTSYEVAKPEVVVKKEITPVNPISRENGLENVLTKQDIVRLNNRSLPFNSPCLSEVELKGVVEYSKQDSKSLGGRFPALAHKISSCNNGVVYQKDTGLRFNKNG